MRKIFLLVVPYIIIGCNSKTPNNTNEQIDYFDQYADDSFRNSIFKIAIQNESTAPNYVVFTAVNLNSGTKKEICCEAPFLSGAIHREFNLPYDQVGVSKVDSILYNNHNRVFNFSSTEALNNIDFFNYPEYNRIIELAKATDLYYYKISFSSSSVSKLKHFKTDTGFQQISFAHILFNSGILVRRDCEAGNNIWIEGTLPKVPTINLEDKIQGAWGNDDIGNAYFGIFGDSIYYPDPNLWYKIKVSNDTLYIIDDVEGIEKIQILRIKNDTLILKYIDFEIIDTVLKR